MYIVIYSDIYIYIPLPFLSSGDINLAWPNSEIAVMGAAGAVNIIFRGLDQAKTEAEVCARCVKE